MTDIEKALDHLDQVRAERAAADEVFADLVRRFERIDGSVLDDNVTCAVWIVAVEAEVPADKRETYWKGMAALAVSKLVSERRDRAAA